MKVADVSFSYQQNIATEEELLQQHATITGWAEALQKRGIEIVVVKRFHKQHSFKKNEVEYYFINDGLKGWLRPWHIPFTFLKKIKQLKADVVHVHGFMFPMQVLMLRLMVHKKTAIVLQHHGGKPSKGIKGIVYGLMNNVADGFFFTSTIQAKEWFNNKKWFHKIMPVMEGSNYFKSFNKQIARPETKLQGYPIFIWVGRLNANKDPLTLLDGFEKLLNKYPSSTLYMIYSEHEQLSRVKNKIESSTFLHSSVHLLGKLLHENLEAYYNSADYFVLGSHYEGSGYALSEALACGCIPIVTAIPSFTMMTDNGKLGALWQPGNSSSFVEAATTALNKDIETESAACTQFFGACLSFDAIASKAIKHYHTAITKRSEKYRHIG